MFVSEVLRNKRVFSITMGPKESVEPAIQIFKDKKVGAIMVCALGGELLGLVTERDVLHAMASHGAETFKQKVGDIMSKAYICKMSDNAESVMRKMSYKHVRHLPVVEDGRIKGMISLGDVIRHQMDENQLEIDTMRDYARAH